MTRIALPLAARLRKMIAPASISGPELDRCNADGPARMTTALNSTPDRSAQSAKRDLFLALANEIEANRWWVDSLGEWELRPESQRQVRVRPPDALRTKAEAARKLRKPTLASVAKQASKAGIEVSRYEVKPDGTVVAVVGKPESATPENPWPLDEFRTKETKQ